MTSRIVRTVWLFLSLLFICQSVPEAGADYYKYRDASGVVCITNKLESVPPKYRASMKVIREDALTRKDPAGQKQTEAAPPLADEAAPQKYGEDKVAPSNQLTAKYPWLKPLAIIGGIIVGFMIVVKLASLLPSPHLARLLYLAFFLSISVYSYKAYADQLVENYFTIKQKMLTMFTKANEREGLQGRKPADGADEPALNR